MSARDAITLAAGDAPVRIDTGTADVFFVDDDGLQQPLVTLGAGAVVVAPSGVVSLRVVPRLGTTLAPVDDGGAPTREGMSDALVTGRQPEADGDRGGDTGGDTTVATVPCAPDDPGVQAFVSALAQRMGGAGETALDGATAATLPDVLAAVLPAFAADRLERRADQVQRGRELDGRAIDEAYRLARQDIERPGHAAAAAGGDELVGTMRVLGTIQGFDVVVPKRLDDDASEMVGPSRLPALAHSSGVRVRPVRLAGDWQAARSTPLLAFTSDDAGPRPIALVPDAQGYRCQRAGDAKLVPLDGATAAALEPTAYELYAPLPRDRAVSRGDVARLSMRRTGADWAWTIGMALGVVLLGMLTPIVTQWVLGSLVPQHREAMLVQVGAGLAMAALLAGAFSFVQYRSMSRLAQRATERVQPAFWDRVLAMPPSFFRSYSAGDLSVRVMAVDSLQQLVNVQVVGALLAAVLSLVNVVLMFRISTSLGVAGAVVLIATLGVLTWCVLSLQRLYATSIDAQLRGTSWVVQLLTGLSKVRLAGAEQRLQSRYLDLVRLQVVALSRMTRVVGAAQAWIVLATTSAPALFFVLGEDLSSAGYVAFNTAFVAAFGAVAGLTAVLTSLASARPIFGLLQPIMEHLPEAATHRADPGRIEGAIELRDVTFRYTPEGPIVLDRIHLRVDPGEMVALVGPSGSGKSSILRIILGFERPDDGQVLLDGRDLEDLDLDLVRGQMGVVIQNGQITRTSILKNILGGVDGDEGAAWAAADAAALVDDIRAMPMKMQTIVDPQLLSGGQAQRILLARALVRQPSLVVLDEATSALDNVSQAKVTESLRRLGATRIVVAHRLSTVRAADRILVVVGGKVVESGTYDDLMAAGGAFAELAARQLA